MSKTYRCRVKVDLQERVHARDAVEYELDMGRILGSEEEAKLLKKKLLEAGGVERGGKVALDIGGVCVEVDPATRRARAQVEEGQEIERHVDEEREVYNVRDSEEEAQQRADKEAQNEARAALEDDKRIAHNRLEAEVRGRLAQALPEIKRRLREVRAEVEKEAIVRKAERLGVVIGRHESEDQKTGDRTLTLELELPD
jgi:hypothetical protein